MNILLVGLPGSGKTTISKYLKNNLLLDYKIINDKDFTKSKDCGKYKKIYRSKEYVVDIEKLNKKLKKYLQENSSNNLLFEGHLWCEVDKDLLKYFSKIFLLKRKRSDLKKIYKKRNYTYLKSLDNLYSFDNKYIESKFLKKDISFKKINIQKNIKENYKNIQKKLNI